MLSVATVLPSAETDPVHHPGDAADDIAVWVHPSDPGLSVIIGTDKAESNPAGGGIAVYDMSGKELQFLPDGDINNVDLRYNFMLDGKPTTVVAASNSDLNILALYTIDPVTRQLKDVSDRQLTSMLDGVSGVAMYQSPESGKYYVFVNDSRGMHEQWELFDAGNGLIDANVVRRFDAGHETEGLVADDELGHLYVSEEEYGIWKYGAEPDAGTKRTLVERVEMDDHDGPLIPDVEGLTIYYGKNGRGYLIASSQGSHDYAVFEREGDNEFIGKFRIGGNKQSGIDRASDSDGIDVVNVPLGSGFPVGAFLAQDVSNGRQYQNFKIVPWQRIAKALVLDTNTDRDPRLAARLEDNGVLRIITTGEDDDVVLRRSGSDIVVKINSNNTWRFASDDVRRVTIDLGDGDDALRVEESNRPFFQPIRAAGRGGNDRLFGGNGNDSFLGGSGYDWLVGHSGDDVLYGGSRSDFIDGGSGNDVYDLNPTRRLAEQKTYAALFMQAT
jgi:myo-inositol-hexaphosphate 3-phosphohydrolase